MNKQAHKSSSRPIAYVLITLLTLVALLHILGVLFTQFAPDSWLASHAKLFDLDNERNVPTVYNGILWGATAFMTLLLALQPQKAISRIRWGFLSLLFFYFAFDEILIIHEHLAAPVRNLLNIGEGNLFYHAWIIPAIVVSLGITIIYKLTANKPRPSAEQKTILKLVVILAFGVISLEAIGTQLYFSQLYYKLGPVMIEELFEMGMISLILYRITGYVIENRDE